MWMSAPSVSAPESKVSDLASTWRSKPLGLRPILRSFTSNGKRMRCRSFLNAWKKGTLPQYLYGAISEQQNIQAYAHIWLEQTLSSSSEASPASLGAVPASKSERQIAETFGRTFGDWWKSTLLLPSSWKTSQDSLFETDSDESQKTYTDWAIKWRQSCSVLRTWVRATAGSGCSAWPTATVANGNGNAQTILNPTPGQTGGETLPGAAQGWSPENWPTPNTAPDAPNCSTTRENGRIAQRLTDQCLGRIAENWPTPRSTMADNGSDSGSALRLLEGANPGLKDSAEQWQTPAVDAFRSRGGDRKAEMGLDQEARNWLTPKIPSGGGMEDRTTPGGGLRKLEDQVENWSTPRGSDGDKGGPQQMFGAGGTPLPSQAYHFLPTAVATQDGSTCSCCALTLRRRYRFVSWLLSGKRQLNPNFAEWLLGLPIGWTREDQGSGPSATEFALYRQQLRLSCYGLLLGRVAK
jgi:hypothetical protein